MIEDVVKLVEEVRQKIVDNYNDMGLRASGRFERELTVEKDGSHVLLTAPDYSWYMENGRAAGKAPPRDVIIQWIRDKRLVFDGISEASLSYLICRKIAREGISVPNPYNPGGVISNIINDQLERDITDKLAGIAQQVIINNLKL